MRNLVRTSGTKTAAVLAAFLGLTLALGGCGDDSLLDVNDPDNVTPEVLEGPGAVSLRTNGLVGDFQEAFDVYALYTGLLTDEFILSGTFETRIDVDRRNVQVNPDNATLTADMYEPLHVARTSADTAVALYRASLDDPEFSDVTDELREGIALGLLYGGYVRVFLAEAYCQSIIGGPDGEASPKLPDERMDGALSRLQEAETAAGAADLPDVATAARIGQARALMWLGRPRDAAAAVTGIDDDFFFPAEYSGNTTGQYNAVYDFTWGDFNQPRWTVGDGDDFPRENEEWPYLGEWVAQGLIDTVPGFEAPEIGVDIALQQLYAQRSSPLPIATGWEARMIEAEDELRNGDPEVAEDLVNDLLTDPSRNPMTQINPGLSLGPFDTVDFTGDLTTDLPQLARARAAGNWLSGQRQGYFRRWREGDGVNLYPDHSPRGADDISFPIVQQEIDNNKNVSSACP